MYAEVYLTLLTCCFSIDIYSFLYRTRVIIYREWDISNENKIMLYLSFFYTDSPPPSTSSGFPLSFLKRGGNGRLADVGVSTFKIRQ